MRSCEFPHVLNQHFARVSERERGEEVGKTRRGERGWKQEIGSKRVREAGRKEVRG